MKNYLDIPFKKYEEHLDNVIYSLDKDLNMILKTPSKGLELYNNTVKSIDDGIYDLFNHHTPLARFLRYGSLPWSIFIPKGYKYFFSPNAKPHIFRPGVHMVRAKVGGGKSLTSFVLAEMHLEETGLGSYFTSPVEKPQTTEDGKWKFVYHRLINLDDYFDSEGTKIKKFNTEKYKIIHKDERHLEFNPRLNSTSGYKVRFISQQKDEILMRHFGMTHIYKYSQYIKLDSQDMQALTFMHDVETVKDIPTKRWLETGNLNYIPVMLKFTSFVIDVNIKGEMKRKKVGSHKIPIPYELLERFDTHAEKFRNAGLPVDYK